MKLFRFWQHVWRFGGNVRSPAAVRSAFAGHPLMRAWWKCILVLHGKPCSVTLSGAEYWSCIAAGFRFYGWLYRILALALLAITCWMGVSGLAAPYWLAFMLAGAAVLWSVTGMAFAGANALRYAAEEGILKLLVFLFLVCLFLASVVVAVSVQAQAVELLPDTVNFPLTLCLLLFGVGSYLVEVVALVTHLKPLQAHKSWTS